MLLTGKSLFWFVWNKLPAIYPCCPGCFSQWQDLLSCLLSDKDIISLYYCIIILYYIILLLCCRRYFSRWQDLLTITREGYYPRSGRAVKLKPKGDSTSRLHPVWMEHQFVRNLGEWQHHQGRSRRVMMKHSQVSCLQTGLGGAV